MASNHPPSPDLIPNPFIKKQNLQWTLSTPSPPPIDINPDGGSPPEPEPRPTTTAAIESGAVLVDDHLARFTDTLTKHTPSSYTPLLPVSSYAALYQSQAGRPDGAHFVIHQHDHPVAGTHYDLRLQINETSSVSWAIMYGLPGDPNSVRLNRNATETRIHSLWVGETFPLLHSLPSLTPMYIEPSHRDCVASDRFAPNMGYRNIHCPPSPQQIRSRR